MDCSQVGKAVKFEFMNRRFESFQSRKREGAEECGKISIHRASTGKERGSFIESRITESV